MKTKITVLSSLLLAATAAHAGVSIGVDFGARRSDLGIGLRIGELTRCYPAPHRIVIYAPASVYYAPAPVVYAAPAPVYVAPAPVCAPTAVVYEERTPVCYAPAPVVYVAPRPVVCSPVVYREAPRVVVAARIEPVRVEYRRGPQRAVVRDNRW